MVAEFEGDLIRLRTREVDEGGQGEGPAPGKQPRLNVRQEAHLVALHRAGEHSVAELGDLFGITPSTVYRAIQRDAARQRTQRQAGTRHAGLASYGDRLPER